MKIIIPGGAGFVGRNLLRILNSERFNMDDVVVIDSSQENLNKISRCGARLIQADLSTEGAWEDEFKGGQIIINIAAQISSPDAAVFEKNNVATIKNIIHAAQKHHVPKIIHFSSAAVLSVRKDPYSVTKAESEKIVISSGLGYCILRPSLMYGPTDDKNIGYLIEFSKTYPMFPIPGNGKWPRQPIYIDDVCRLLIRMVSNFPTNAVLGINGHETINFIDMIQTVQSEMGGARFCVRLPIPVFKALMMVYQTFTGNVKFTTDQVDSLTAEEIFPEYRWWDEYGIPITSFRNGVRQMIATEGDNAQ